MASNTLPRDYDIARMLADYRRRIEVLERRLQSLFGNATPQTVATQGARVTRNSDQLLAHASFVNVDFQAEVIDNNAMWSNVDPERITANVAGFYTIGANIELQAANDYTRVILSFRHNGSTRIAFTSTPGVIQNAAQRFALSTVYYLDAGDFVDFQIHQTNSASAARNVLATTDYSPQFWAVRIG